MKRFIIALFLVSCASAQDIPQHKFFSKSNVAGMSALGGLMAADGWTTRQIILQGGNEYNPIAKPFVHSDVKIGGATAVGYVGLVSLAYMFHSTNHHKLERITLWVPTAMEAGAVANNSLWLSNRR